MTDKELLAFCKEHNVELSIGCDVDPNNYRLRMRRGWLQINYIFSSESIDAITDWDTVVKAKLQELEEGLSCVSRAE